MFDNIKDLIKNEVDFACSALSFQSSNFQIKKGAYEIKEALRLLGAYCESLGEVVDKKGNDLVDSIWAARVANLENYSFMLNLRAGLVTIDDLEKYVEKWHTGYYTESLPEGNAAW